MWEEEQVSIEGIRMDALLLFNDFKIGLLYKKVLSGIEYLTELHPITIIIIDVSTTSRAETLLARDL